MARAKRPADTGKQLDPAAQRRAADLLRATHDQLCLWRTCTKKACRRLRNCCGDVDQCGARSFPQDWKWVDHVLQAIRDGQSPSAAVRAADRHVEPWKKHVTIHFGFGKPFEFYVDHDGAWVPADDPRAKVKFGVQFRRLTGAAWSRVGGAAK